MCVQCKILHFADNKVTEEKCHSIKRDVITLSMIMLLLMRILGQWRNLDAVCRNAIK